jgi:hypothetical protein
MAVIPLPTQSILLLRGPVGVSFWDIISGEEFGVSSLANSILDRFIELSLSDVCHRCVTRML